jgi:hypothetical protein
MMHLSDDLRFQLVSWRKGLLNTSTLVRRNFDAGIYSTKNSGMHWLRYMFGLLLARLHDLPPPEHIGWSAFVGRPKALPRLNGVPRLVASHSIAHPALRLAPVFRLGRQPRYLLLVRDIRAILVSVYEKWYRHDGRVSFSEFLRGDVANSRTYICDIWELMRFYNQWGPVLERFPDRCMLVRYEDMVAAPQANFGNICQHFGLTGVTPALLREVVGQASKEEMARRPDPTEPRHDKVVRADGRSVAEWYGDADRDFVAQTLRRNLRYNFGYAYH